MPPSPVIRRARHWPEIEARVRSLRPSIPAEGITQAEFEAAVLTDVNPGDVAEAVRLLARRRLIWRAEKRGAVRVFAARPANPVVWEPVGRASPLGPLMTATAAPAYALACALDHGGREPRATEAIRIAANRLATAALRHVGDSVAEADKARLALWRLYPDDVMQALSMCEPLFQLENKGALLHRQVANKNSARLPRGLTVINKILMTISKSCEPVSATYIQKRIRPMLNSNDLASLLQQLVTEGSITSVETKQGRGRPCVRYCIRT